MKFGVNSDTQTATILCNSSEIKFDDTAVNSISFSARPGLTPNSVNVVTNNDSFLTKSETLALIGSGSGGGSAGASITTTTDGSSASISSNGVFTV